MAEECQYYHYDSGFWGDGYTCLLKQSEGKDRKLDSDWLHKYCWNYNYGDCPFYQVKHGSSSSGCYLTSACVEARGLLDDCAELTALRQFRDEYVRCQPGGEADIKHYYAVAPQIVAAIHALDCPQALAVLDELYTGLVQPCIRLIEQGKNESAYQLYKQNAMQLEKQYLTKEEQEQ